jgi:hypothetical protein
MIHESYSEQSTLAESFLTTRRSEKNRLKMSEVILNPVEWSMQAAATVIEYKTAKGLDLCG